MCRKCFRTFHLPLRRDSHAQEGLGKIAVQHSTSSLCSEMAKAGNSTFALLREQDLRHHALVLVIQQMTMEH
jgi:hypothetical protein